MRIALSKEYYNLAKSVDYSDMGGHIHFDDISNSIELDNELVILEDYFGSRYEVAPIEAMLGCIVDEVAVSGLSEDQNKVLPRGRKLYELHDSIFYSLSEE